MKCYIMYPDHSKIYVAQFYTNNIAYGKYSEKINENYCKGKGYSYYCEKDDSKIRNAIGDRSPTWYKPLFVLEIFEKFNPDVVLFLDMDAIVSDFEQRIETYIQATDLTICQDYSGHSVANAGVFILKNTVWAKHFLTQWWESSYLLNPSDYRNNMFNHQSIYTNGYYKNALWHDQACFTILYEANENVKKNTTIITNRYLNHNQYNQNNFIFHAFAYGMYNYRSLDIICNKLYPSEKPNINLIVYHIYCVGDYINIFKRQLDRLISSGLYEWCDKLVITCINENNKFEEIETLIQLSKIEFHKYIDNAYEHHAIKKVWEYSQTYTGKVLYFHSKGTFNNFKSFRKKTVSTWKIKGVSWWKEAMEYNLIDNYKICLEKLDIYDQCGLSLNMKGWCGNFWWCRLDWISSINAPGKGDRWLCEKWLNNTTFNPSYYEFYHIHFNPYYTIIPDDIYSNREKYKDSIIEIENFQFL